MGLDLIPADVLERFHIGERHHACAILAGDFPDEFGEILDCLRHFQLVRDETTLGRGQTSNIAERFDEYLKEREWKKKGTGIEVIVDGVTQPKLTHQVDFSKSGVAIDCTWNNDGPLHLRDFNAFRLLHDSGRISVGIVVTLCEGVPTFFGTQGSARDHKPPVEEKPGWTASWHTLLERVNAGACGACPLLLVGIRPAP